MGPGGHTIYHNVCNVSWHCDVAYRSLGRSIPSFQKLLLFQGLCSRLSLGLQWLLHDCVEEEDKWFRGWVRGTNSVPDAVQLSVRRRWTCEI